MGVSKAKGFFPRNLSRNIWLVIMDLSGKGPISPHVPGFYAPSSKKIFVRNQVWRRGPLLRASS